MSQISSVFIHLHQLMLQQLACSLVQLQWPCNRVHHTVRMRTRAAANAAAIFTVTLPANG